MKNCYLQMPTSQQNKNFKLTQGISSHNLKEIYLFSFHKKFLITINESYKIFILYRLFLRIEV